MDDKNKLVTAEELKYVYDQIPDVSSKLDLAGGTITGNLTVNGTARFNSDVDLGDKAIIDIARIEGTEQDIGTVFTDMDAIRFDSHLVSTDYNIYAADVYKIDSSTKTPVKAAYEGHSHNYSELSGLPGAMSYLTTAPTEDNPNGLMIVVLSEEPTVKYSGYLYVITD